MDNPRLIIRPFHLVLVLILPLAVALAAGAGLMSGRAAAAVTDADAGRGRVRQDAPPAPGLRLRPRWTFPTGAEIRHPPVVASGRVFVASHADVLHALDLRSGRPLWSYRPPAGHLWNGSLAVSSGALFVGTQGGHLVSLDQATGRVNWRRSLRGEVKFRPAVAGGILYVTTTFAGGRMEKDPAGRATVYALRAADGTTVWERATENYALREPFLLGEMIVVGGSFHSDAVTEDGEGGWTRLYALDTRTGRPRWTNEAPDGFVKTIYGAGDTVAYVGYADVIRGLDAASGREKWLYNTENWTQGMTGYGRRIYFGSANGFVHALDVATGRAVWRYNQYGVFNYVVGAPVLMGGVLYYQTTYGEIWALEAAGGRLLGWGKTGVESRGSLGAAAGLLFLGGVDGVLHAYDAGALCR